MPKPTASTSGLRLISSDTDSTIASITACSDRPVTTRCTRSWTSSCSSITPASSFVPPRSTPITLRLMGEGALPRAGIYACRSDRQVPSLPVEPLTASATGAPLRDARRQARLPRIPLPPGVPEPPVQPARGRALRAARGTWTRVRELSGDRPAAGDRRAGGAALGAHLPAAPADRPARALVAADHLEEGGRRRARLHRVLAGAQPRALHDQREPAVGQGLRRHQGGARRLGQPAHVARTTSSCWAPTAARERSAAAPTRSC